MQRLLNNARTYSLAFLLALTLFAQAARWMPQPGRFARNVHAPAPMVVCPGEGEGDVCD